MRVVVALGGNALLRRGQPMTRREPARERGRRVRPSRADRRAPRARDLARQRSADRAARAGGGGVRGRARRAARRAGRRDPGDDRLPRRAGARQPAAVRQAARLAAHDDRSRSRRSRVRRSDEADRPAVRRRAEADDARGRARLGVQARRRQHAPRRAVAGTQRIFEHRPIRWLLEHGCVVICAGGGGIPTAYRAGPPARRRRGRHRQGPRRARCSPRHRGRHRSIMATDAPAAFVGFGTPEQRAIAQAHPDALLADYADEFAAGSMLPKVHRRVRLRRARPASPR